MELLLVSHHFFYLFNSSFSSEVLLRFILLHNSSEVYMQDLESGLSYMLKIEVANKPIIEGRAYVALRNFIDMLGKVRHVMYDRMITIFLSSISLYP